MTRLGNICKKCGSMAINPHRHGRDPNDDLDLCDVCYWRKRAEACQWQPIETARKNTNEILFVDKQEFIGICWWSKSRKGWESVHTLRNDECESPTHWIPLPDPPKDEP